MFKIFRHIYSLYKKIGREIRPMETVSNFIVQGDESPTTQL